MTDIHAVIIDDSEMGLNVLGNMLELAGVQYTPIQDARQTGKVLSKLPKIDLIFLDLEMPYLTGPEVLALIKQELGIVVPVIAYSVHTSEIQLVREWGFDGFLGKPVNMKEFPTHLRNILQGIPVWVAN